MRTVTPARIAWCESHLNEVDKKAVDALIETVAAATGFVRGAKQRKEAGSTKPASFSFFHAACFPNASQRLFCSAPLRSVAGDAEDFGASLLEAFGGFAALLLVAAGERAASLALPGSPDGFAASLDGFAASRGADGCVDGADGFALSIP